MIVYVVHGECGLNGSWVKGAYPSLKEAQASVVDDDAPGSTGWGAWYITQCNIDTGAATELLYSNDGNRWHKP